MACGFFAAQYPIPNVLAIHPTISPLGGPLRGRAGLIGGTSQVGTTAPTATANAPNISTTTDISRISCISHASGATVNPGEGGVEVHVPSELPRKQCHRAGDILTFLNAYLTTGIALSSIATGITAAKLINVPMHLKVLGIPYIAGAWLFSLTALLTCLASITFFTTRKSDFYLGWNGLSTSAEQTKWVTTVFIVCWFILVCLCMSYGMIAWYVATGSVSNTAKGFGWACFGIICLLGMLSTIGLLCLCRRVSNDGDLELENHGGSLCEAH